jgi:Plasmid encoded RepA protein
MATKKPAKLDVLKIDYRAGQLDMPSWVREAIDTSFAIEAEDAKSAGALGYMARALVQATMPYKDPKAPMFVRRNGDFTLTIIGGFEGLVPYGVYPRLLVSWIATQAVRTKSPEIELGDSLNDFLRNVLEIQRGGGVNGPSTRVSQQMARLFGSLITARWGGRSAGRGFDLANVSIVDKARVSDRTMWELDNLGSISPPPSDAEDDETRLWTPQASSQAGRWKSIVRLSENFYQECVNSPVPIDLRAYKALRRSPMAMDLYSWLTYRMSYTKRPTRPIPWEALQLQFGSNFSQADRGQATRDFRKNFLNALRAVHTVYPQAKIDIAENGVVLQPSKPHIPIKVDQQPLF